MLVCFGRLFSHSPIKVEAVFESLLGDSFFNAGQGMSSRFSAAMIGLLERGAASKELRYYLAVDHFVQWDTKTLTSCSCSDCF